MELRNGKISQVAKVIAIDRHKRKEKHRQVRRWVLDKYKSDPASVNDPADVDGSDAESAPETTVARRKRDKKSVWSQKASSGGQNGPPGVTLGGMLAAAKIIYSDAAADFDKMNLYEHMSYILSFAKRPDTPLPKAIVSREVVVMAQHQMDFAKEDISTCLAVNAVAANVSLLNLNDEIKRCQNCLCRFRYPSRRYIPRKLHALFTRPCLYHPGQVRSYNDAIDKNDKNRRLGSGYLSEGRVNLGEFKIWMQTCYWDCCGGKLLEVGPEAGKRSQRKKKDILQSWEKPHEYDGKVGCQTSRFHTPIVL
ncbi:hypothetical protein F4805DRAFT_298608 [Annulohypoxylon moriforme]|nr:hypothetical protein F4805DRAFT_298608 [Annulohypoxylon moriforme]